MIENLGLSPITDASYSLRREFYSIFRRRPGVISSGFTSSGAYTTNRGILIDKSYLDETPSDLTKGYSFQFNPETITDSKETPYGELPYAGLPYVDYVWSGGSSRNISFQLTLDDTPGSKTNYFRPDVLANVPIVTESKGVKSNNHKNLNIEYTNTAYSNSRVHERGILDSIDLIRSFSYPKAKDDIVPKFSEGGIVEIDQFRPPPIVVLCLGPLYYEGIITASNITYTLFDRDLTPLRGTIDVEFRAFEFINSDRLL